jgi:hypothetical protein
LPHQLLGDPENLPTPNATQWWKNQRWEMVFAVAVVIPKVLENMPGILNANGNLIAFLKTSKQQLRYQSSLLSIDVATGKIVIKNYSLCLR